MKTKLPRILSFLLAIVLLLLPLSACRRAARTLDELETTKDLVIYLPQNDGISGSGGNLDMYTSHWTYPFWRLYDNAIHVRIVEIPGSLEDYEERVMSELVSGAGPDIIFTRFLPHMDVEKSARNYSFYDLTGLMESDPDFHAEDFIDGVFDAVKIDGRQYTVPIAYNAPVYFSDQNKLRDLGFDWDGIGTTSDFIDELVRMKPKAAEDLDFIQMLGSRDSFAELLGFSGIRLVDFETGTALPDEASFRAFMESYKAFYAFDHNTLETFNPWNHDGYYAPAYAVVNGGILFYFEPMLDVAGYRANVIEEAEDCTAGYGILPAQTGETVGVLGAQLAINTSSKNVKNAWTFIKYIISEQVQTGGSYSRNLNGVPVRRDSVRASVARQTGLFGTSERAGLLKIGQDEIVERYEKMDRFVWGTSATALDLTWESMLPWLQDEKSYEDCVSELKSKLTFYMSE